MVTAPSPIRVGAHAGIVRRLDDLPPGTRGCVLSVGNFDGVHQGHRRLLADARARADAARAALVVMLFDPSPREYFAPDAPVRRLSDVPARARLLVDAGVDVVLALPFDTETANLDPERFVSHVLHDGLHVGTVAVGADFRFGRGRRGDIVTLRALAARYGFTAYETPVACDADTGRPYSSSDVRDRLSAGRPDDAARILGRPWSVTAPVRRDRGIGRTLGFATANMTLDGLVCPAFGAYAVRVDLPDGRTCDGVANIGIRPTFGGRAPTLEVHLFDFCGDLYERTVSVALISFLRSERTFDGPHALKAQIERDARAARDSLAAEGVRR